MATLEALLDEHTPQIQHLTLSFTMNEGRWLWQGACRFRGHDGYRIAFSDDPAEALANAITAPSPVDEFDFL